MDCWRMVIWRICSLISWHLGTAHFSSLHCLACRARTLLICMHKRQPRAAVILHWLSCRMKSFIFWQLRQVQLDATLPLFALLLSELHGGASTNGNGPKWMH